MRIPNLYAIHVISKVGIFIIIFAIANFIKHLRDGDGKVREEVALTRVVKVLRERALKIQVSLRIAHTKMMTRVCPMMGM